MDQRNNAPHYDQSQNSLQMNSMQLYEQQAPQYSSNANYQSQGYMQPQQQQQSRSGFDLVNSLLGGALTSFQKPQQQQAPQQQILQAQAPQQYQYNNSQQPNNQQQLYSQQFSNNQQPQQQYAQSIQNQASMQQAQQYGMQNSGARQYLQQPSTPFNLDYDSSSSLQNQQLDNFAHQMDVLVQQSAPTPAPQPPPQQASSSSSSSSAPQGYAEDVLQLVVEQQRRIVQLEQELDKARAYISKLQDFTKQLETEKHKNKKQSRYWTQQEHQKFLDAIAKFGRKDVKAIANHVGSRNATQVRTHAQKYYAKLDRDAKRGKDQGYDDAGGLLLDAGLAGGPSDHQQQQQQQQQHYQYQQQPQQENRSSSSESMTMDQQDANNN